MILKYKKFILLLFLSIILAGILNFIWLKFNLEHNLTKSILISIGVIIIAKIIGYKLY
ncbi:hypothetical protein [Oceanivirga salmonicida]|uniref:hypothetical protein n=1 Tax=Oceanivirga salmonicida TaxID=1769291 RepID=UPI0012E281B5|nr:hypothetical protein [Oceanivirga salmonicida]